MRARLAMPCFVVSSFLSHVCAGAPSLLIDTFTDGGVSLTTGTETVTFESGSAALGGYRVGSFVTSGGEGEVVLDEAAGAIGFEAAEQATLNLGYGIRLPPGGATFVVDGANALDADVSAFDAVRFEIEHVGNAESGIVIEFFLFSGTNEGAVATSFGEYTSPLGFTGAFDCPFDALVGSASLADLDHLTIRALSTGVSQAWRVGSIAFVSTAQAICAGDCDGSGEVDFNDLVAMLFEFGAPGSPDACDADGSGVVEFNDLVAALFVFGPCAE